MKAKLLLEGAWQVLKILIKKIPPTSFIYFKKKFDWPRLFFEQKFQPSRLFLHSYHLIYSGLESKLNILGEHNEVDVKLDLALPAEVRKNFRKTFFVWSDFLCWKYISLPGLSWDVMLWRNGDRYWQASTGVSYITYPTVQQRIYTWRIATEIKDYLIHSYWIFYIGRQC